MSDRFNVRTGVICFALALATLALYWPVSGYDFLNYDDPLYVTENAHVLGGLRWGNVVWAFSTFHTGNWHPLTWLSHMLDCQWFGHRPAAAHVVNVVFHAANSLLLFLVCKRLTGAVWRSTLIAALFALHPAHVESVAWVAERKDVLSAFFFLLTLGAYAEYASRKEADKFELQGPKLEDRKKSKVQSPKSEAQMPRSGPGFTHPASRIPRHTSLFYSLALLCFALGLMSKPMLVTLPFVLLLLDYWPLQRLQFKPPEADGGKLLPLVVEKLPFFALSVGGSVVTFFAQQAGGTVNSLDEVSLGGRLANALVSY